MNRRQVLQKSLLGIGSLALGGMVQAKPVTFAEDYPIKHSVARWCYQDISLEELCERGRDIGLKSIELLQPSEWDFIKSYGLKCALGTAEFISIEKGFNNKLNHRRLIKGYLELIQQATEADVPTLVCYSGNRNKINSEKGMDNCVRGLKEIMADAEKAGVVIAMELLNSKIDHKDYMADNVQWGIELVNKVNSPNFRLIYDVYEMQIMEGNLVNTIRQYHTFFAHYQVAGVPGRRELNSSQEINYAAVIKAILETGYTGYVGQEFIPSYEDKISALEEGVWICTQEE